MSSKAPIYDVVKEYGDDLTRLSSSPGWAVCVVRLGLPLSYSREKGKSVTTDVSQGAHLRGPNLIITSDCISLNVSGSKDSHTKTLVAELRQTDHNYLVEILPGDWVLAWMVHDETALEELLKRVKEANPDKPCNGFDDGFKFLGRVDGVRKRMHLDRSSGMKTSSVTMTAIGFRELDTQFFYDSYLSKNDDSTIGSWLTQVGLDLEVLFSVDIKKGEKNNSRKLIAALLDLLVGKGVKNNKVNAAEQEVQKNGQSQFGSLQATAGAGTTASGQEAPFSYLVPRVVGALMGKKAEDASKNGGIMSYADILETLMGVQTYNASAGGNESPGTLLNPTISSESWPARMYTGKDLLGSFLPVMPQFTNKPLWSVLQQFLNETINEMYTAMRVNPAGQVVPTLVVRQIPFTTEAFHDTSQDVVGAGPKPQAVDTTPFLTVPRWKLHPVMVNDLDIGRSDATRINFVHIYGQDANLSADGQVTFTQQLVSNPPSRDDLDIQRSGLRSYMTTVACTLRDQVGRTPGTWMALVADWTIGSQYTLNGTLSSVGIRAPICEGDNLEFDSVVYHIQSVSHHCMIEANGGKSWSTTVTLTNGMRSDGVSDVDSVKFPMYPGLKAADNTALDPGLSIDDKYDRTDPRVKDGDLVTPQPPGGTDNSREMTDDEFMQALAGVKAPEGPTFGPDSSGGGGLDDL